MSAAVAAPALAGIPLTHRQLTQGFTVVSGHLPPGDPGSTLDWAALARANTTLVIMMGVATLPAITAELLRHGLDPDTPAATVANAGLPGQQTVRGTLADIAELTRTAGVRPPAVTVIGAVVGFDRRARPVNHAATLSLLTMPHRDGRRLGRGQRWSRARVTVSPTRRDTKRAT